ncbi:hypothetical protein A2W39_00865 [Candidatus Azambacteria bacterium RIFCSPHIGHO2_01_46_10]|uniref:Uncharacterized protein n=2 Tax=Candidatus Azamiibacteriota TaxID=1752741 RepID=A0A1F5BZR2_9BACT|nr:MAG: hypothetical protein UX33_C0037G0001 [Candidatus Azambacteria bacterium GW2011_GWC1_46_13]OGD36089.1 MAG: hypothetical protein A2W39_00865 [Candidatus Azambacteria bacterium RIFCSPHIGHO2_01_46_10]HBA52834.1 hypothetical protein [Candidatus Azambacteria bacterium]
MNQTTKIIIGIVIVIVVIWGGYALLKGHQEQAVTEPTVSTQLSQKVQQGENIQFEQSLQNKSGEQQQVDIKKIFLKTSFKNPYNKLPKDLGLYLRVANGHYLFSNEIANESIYDGKKISIKGSLVALSQNGFHFAHTVERGNPGIEGGESVVDLYVDGNLVANNIYNLGDVQITNNGKHYFYQTIGDAGTNSTLVKDGVKLIDVKSDYWKGGIQGFAIDDDNGFDLIVYISNLSGHKLIYKSKEISKNNIYSFSISPNGKHYAYVESLESKGDEKKYSVIVDGDIKIKNIFSAGVDVKITNSGHYVVNDISNKRAYIDGKLYNLKADFAKAYINNDASHFLIIDNEWQLDDKVLSLNINMNNFGGVEILDNTVYIYEFEFEKENV